PYSTPLECHQNTLRSQACLTTAAPNSASRSGIIRPTLAILGQSDVSLSGAPRQSLSARILPICGVQCELAASTTQSGPPCGVPSSVGRPANFPFPLSPHLCFHRHKSGSPTEVRTRGVAMRKRLTLTTGLASVVACTIGVSAQAYEAGPVTGGGTIDGKVIFNGAVPTRKIIPNKDVEVCGGIREEPLIEVGPDKGVQNAVVYLVDVAKGKAWPAAGKPPELDNIKCRFVPNVQVIPAGPLVVVNDDPVLHNTHGYYGKRTAFNMALPNQGQRIPTELTRAGTVRVDCDAHGWMEGWIYVVDNPYYAITGADGKFSIADVPPGNYTLVTIQSFTGPLQQSVTVEGGKPTNLNIELKKR